MKIVVNSVATVKSKAAMDPVMLAQAAQKIVGRQVVIEMEPLQKVSELADAAQAAFAFDASIVISKAFCEIPGVLSNDVAITAAGIRDGDSVNCRFTIEI